MTSRKHKWQELEVPRTALIGGATGGLITRFDDMAVVCKPIQQDCCHLGVADHARPFREAQVGRDCYAGVLVKLCNR